MTSCSCSEDTGCPNCVQVGFHFPVICNYIDFFFFFKLLKRVTLLFGTFQNLSCQEYNKLLHKDAAIMIIKVIYKHSPNIKTIKRHLCMFRVANFIHDFAGCFRTREIELRRYF